MSCPLASDLTSCILSSVLPSVPCSLSHIKYCVSSAAFRLSCLVSSVQRAESGIRYILFYCFLTILEGAGVAQPPFQCLVVLRKVRACVWVRVVHNVYTCQILPRCILVAWFKGRDISLLFTGSAARYNGTSPDSINISVT